MAQLTTGTDIICPHCKREVEIETEGLLGGIMKQMLIGAFITRLKTEGGTVTCGKCKNKFKHEPTRR